MVVVIVPRLLFFEEPLATAITNNGRLGVAKEPNANANYPCPAWVELEKLSEKNIKSVSGTTYWEKLVAPLPTAAAVGTASSLATPAA